MARIMAEALRLKDVWEDGPAQLRATVVRQFEI
jgi:hypothetical protein